MICIFAFATQKLNYYIKIIVFFRLYIKQPKSYKRQIERNV